MKMNTKLPLACAISALLVSPLALSDGHTDDPIPDPDLASFNKIYNKTDTQAHTSTSNATSQVILQKQLTTTKSLTIAGQLEIEGDIWADAAALAVINDKQANVLNETFNDKTQNSATVLESVGESASGDIGINISSGDNIQQDNATALTVGKAGDGSLMFSVDAEVFSYQDSEFNDTDNNGTTNEATLGDSALATASGNIGVNIAAGTNIQQKNNLAVAVVDNGILAEANVSAEQYSDHNYTTNDSTVNTSSIAGWTLSSATGRVGLNVSSGTNNQQANHMAITAITGI